MTEGQIDAITLEQYGGAAVASNEAAQLIAAIREAGDRKTATAFLIVPDAGDANGTGEAKAARMLEALAAEGETAYIYPLPPGFHDTNDMATKAAADLYDWTRNAGAFVAEQSAAKKAEYMQITGAARMQSLQATACCFVPA